MAGVPEDLAFDIAWETMAELREKENGSPDVEELTDAVRADVRRHGLDAEAERFATLLRWLQKPTPVSVLIMGGPGTGKSAVATAVARAYEIKHHINTGVIRDVLRKLLASDLAPTLHGSSYDAWRKLRPAYSARFEEVLVGFIEHARFVEVGLESVLRRARTEGLSIVVEGVQVLPHLIERVPVPNRTIPIALEIKEPKEHREMIAASPIETERRLSSFDNIRKIHDYIIHESRLRGIAVIDAGIDAEPEQEALKLIGESIERIIA